MMLLVTVVTTSPLLRCAADPPASDSKYLHSFGGGFAYHRLTHLWSMLLIVSIKKKSSGNGALYYVATFENPLHGRAPLIVESSSLKADVVPTVSLDSPPVTGMVDGKTYEITVDVYADEAHATLLGKHRQKIVFHDLGDPEAYANKVDYRRAYYQKHGSLPPRADSKP